SYRLPGTVERRRGSGQRTGRLKAGLMLNPRHVSLDRALPWSPQGIPSCTTDGARQMTPDRSPAADRARLIELIKARSFERGREVKLVSGRTSTFYFNMKPTMLDAEGSLLIANLILDQLEGVAARWIGGLEMGA